MKIFQFNYTYLAYVDYVLITEIFNEKRAIVEYLNLNVAQNCT